MAYSRGEMAVNAAHQIRFLKLTKIHIQCVDKDGSPMAGRPYRIQLPTGEIIETELDDQGWAKHDDIYPGECTFELFPEGEALVPTAQPAQIHEYHLRLRFEDENGDPFVSKPFELDTGTLKIEGMTDETGKLIADVPTSCAEGEVTIWLDADKSGESYTWPLRISDVAN